MMYPFTSSMESGGGVWDSNTAERSDGPSNRRLRSSEVRLGLEVSQFTVEVNRGELESTTGSVADMCFIARVRRDVQDASLSRDRRADSERAARLSSRRELQ